MTKRSKKYTIISAIFTGFLWFLAIIFPICNLLGLWALWHLAGFGMLLYAPIPLTLQLIAISVTASDTDKDALMINIFSLVISVILPFVSLCIASTWGIFW